jgi:hypothetical protein
MTMRPWCRLATADSMESKPSPRAKTDGKEGEASRAPATGGLVARPLLLPEGRALRVRTFDRTLASYNSALRPRPNNSVVRPGAWPSHSPRNA